MPAFGLDADVISWVIGAAVALGFAAAAFVLRLPRAIVTVVTALWGAGATLGGVMVLLQIIEPEELGFGGVDAVVSESILWLLAFIALAVVGRDLPGDDVCRDRHDLGRRDLIEHGSPTEPDWALSEVPSRLGAGGRRSPALSCCRGRLGRGFGRRFSLGCLSRRRLSRR